MALRSNIFEKPEHVKEQERRDRADRQDAFIKSRIKRAELAEKEQGHESPDVIYPGMQRDDVFTQDLSFDASRKAIMHRTSLPVKQYEINPDGTFVKVLGEAALAVVQEGMFCFRCEEREPESEVEKREAAQRLFDAGLLVDTKHLPKENCAYCGARLGLQGDNSYDEKPIPQQVELAELMGISGKELS